MPAASKATTLFAKWEKLIFEPAIAGLVQLDRQVNHSGGTEFIAAKNGTHGTMRMRIGANEKRFCPDGEGIAAE